MDIFFDYHWPGNVRELRSVIEYAFVVCDGKEITKEHLMPSLLTQKKRVYLRFKLQNFYGQRRKRKDNRST
ncbi:hypothetical protein JCM12298_02490 [Desulfothermus naphthae]